MKQQDTSMMRPACKCIALIGMIVILFLLLLAGVDSALGNIFQLNEAPERFKIIAANYSIEINKLGFRFSFYDRDGKIVAKEHAQSGLEFAGGLAENTKLISVDDDKIILSVANDKTQRATVEIQPHVDWVKFSVKAPTSGRIVARTAGISPAFGLADHKAREYFGKGEFHHASDSGSTELTGFVNDELHADGSPCSRLVSNFVIFPRARFAEVNIEPYPKVVRLTQNENAQGSSHAETMPALYYFFGSPQTIYASYLKVRNENGYPTLKPKYEWFGVGWEAWGALAWDTNQKTVTENIQRYLDLGYPLSWAVIGSGFWPRSGSNLMATTSFGMWDPKLYPRPRAFIDSLHQKGLKVMLGLRIGFITDGPYAEEGLRKGCFILETGSPKVFKIAFPKRPVYLLDSSNPAAVRWYVQLCQKWLDYGVDGFKEDMFGYSKYVLPDNKLNPLNEALMQKGVYVMGRNGYLSCPADLQRYDDFNFAQNQDRGPINGLTFAYCGFANVYPDIVGGSFGISEMQGLAYKTSAIRNYFMRNAVYASVNPSMAMGFGPWNFEDEELSRVTLAAAQLHAQLQPYIFSAAVDSAQTGFPTTITPLCLLWPDDPEVYQLENIHRRSYEWMFGPSLLAVPLYGDDCKTAQTRDVYLPKGKWIDYDTGDVYVGPKTLKKFPLPVGKTPLFIGGKGILVERDLKNHKLIARVFPIADRGAKYQFTGSDGLTRSQVSLENQGWNRNTLSVFDANAVGAVHMETEARGGAIRFSLEPGHDYCLTGGAEINAQKLN